jgi:coenzyme F420-reducing hydrogenase alpha subunit
MISFRTKRDKEDMLHKAKQMQKFADEFVECIEECEYERDERSYRDEDMDREETRYRRRMRDGRYSY